MTNLLLNEGAQASSIVWLVILIGMVVMMLVLPSMTQKKRVKAYEEMKSRLRAGDRIQTIGGIVGRIVRIKESNGAQTVVVETGDKSNKSFIEFDINAIAGVVEGLNNTHTDAKVEEKPEEVNVDWQPEEFTTEEAVDNKESETKTQATNKKSTKKK